jgi:hypothetical protein
LITILISRPERRSRTGTDRSSISVQATSLFTGGRITDDLGAFIQGTYDNVTRRFGWDNADMRYVDTVKVGDHSLLWGVTLNNNPTVPDVWNTIPAWRFPYISSELMPLPAAKSFIDLTYAQQVAGLGAYGFLDDLLVSLTETGRAYYERCTRLLADLVSYADCLQIHGVGCRGRARVRTSQFLALSCTARSDPRIATGAALSPAVNACRGAGHS